jgi:hypothetical protein
MAGAAPVPCRKANEQIPDRMMATNPTPPPAAALEEKFALT